MSTLIIPDIHHHIENAEYWLRTQRFDRAVFLGDYFDGIGDNANDARRTAVWLKKRMENTNDVFLLGNHDLAYMFPKSEALNCPGFTKAKAKSIREILGPEHWARFRIAHAENGWLMSHAGFHPVWIENPTVERILERCEQAVKKAKKRVLDPILEAGQDRGGLQKFGGPLWMDWKSLVPIDGINQMVGHSAGRDVRKKLGTYSKNYCLDVRSASVAALLYDGWYRILKRDHEDTP